MIQAPVFHVNGEDPEATCYLTELALELRQEFKRHVVVDMFCYRRHGHNESDEPSYTQPIMYGKIRNRPSLTSIYTEQLIMMGDLTVAETEEIADGVAFLASGRAGYITGETIGVSGGMGLGG